MPSPDTGLRALDSRTLLRQYAETLTILLERGVVRSRNAPAGDLAETLVSHAYGGQLAPPSQKSWDVQLPDGTTLQVKCRVIDPQGRRSQVYSPFRSWSFDRCVFVLLDIETYEVISGVEVPAASLRSIARRSEWVAGDRIGLSTDLTSLDSARDVTEMLSAAMAALE